MCSEVERKRGGRIKRGDPGMKLELSEFIEFVIRVLLYSA